MVLINYNIGSDCMICATVYNFWINDPRTFSVYTLSQNHETKYIKVSECYCHHALCHLYRAGYTSLEPKIVFFKTIFR